MAATEYIFDDFRSEIIRLIKQPLGEDKNEDAYSDLIQKLQVMIPQDKDNANDIRSAIDQSVRDVLDTVVQAGALRENVESALNLGIALADVDICSGNLPGMLLCDMFDTLTLDRCEELFDVVEDRVEVWKQDLFFRSCKNQLLRTCNDLLRRLSKSQNTVFCGRILVFLARLFPLSERSGLNIISEFNSDNITLFSSQDDRGVVEEEGMDDSRETEATGSISVDYNLYRKFWSLQDYFRQPNLCYQKVQWRQFTTYSNDVLSVFSSYKLDDVKSAKWNLSESTSAIAGNSMYFAKYLTSQKLLELELSDSNFRRYILVQFLILFQYLQSSVKFKQESFILTEDQNTWIKNCSTQVYKLLEETPPDGSDFAKHITRILQREEFWNTWKNDGCPNFREAKPIETSLREGRPKRRLGDELRAADATKKILLGNPELTRLWNLCPNNWEACESQKRDFVPSLDKFFEPAIEQADPKNQIENRFKHVYDSNYGWRALRLLSQKSPHFFTSSNQPIKSLPLYLESMVSRLAKELPVQPNSSNTDDSRGDVQAYTGEDSEDELLKSEEAPKEMQEVKAEATVADTIGKDQIPSLASALGSEWKKIAPKLSFTPDEVLYFTTEHKEIAKQAQHMLTAWIENEPEEATMDNFLKAASSVGLKLDIGST